GAAEPEKFSPRRSRRSRRRGGRPRVLVLKFTTSGKRVSLRGARRAPKQSRKGFAPDALPRRTPGFAALAMTVICRRDRPVVKPCAAARLSFKTKRRGGASAALSQARPRNKVRRQERKREPTLRVRAGHS